MRLWFKNTFVSYFYFLFIHGLLFWVGVLNVSSFEQEFSSEVFRRWKENVPFQLEQKSCSGF